MPRTAIDGWGFGVAQQKVAGLITPDRYDAALFDLDGVLTDTASTHAAAWKQTFDAFLEQWSKSHGVPFVPFDIDSDYVDYVDGKPRYEGVQSFLTSRHIELPWGSDDDPPGDETVCAVGNRKNDLVLELIAKDGVTVYPGSVKLLHHFRSAGIKTAVVSSSKNCLDVITAAGIADQFDTRIDGVVAEERGLAGKPKPDTYLEAAREVGASAARSVVFEDALAGVESGRAGDFGLVVGVDRKGDPSALRERGADVVVQDLAELLPDSGTDGSHSSHAPSDPEG